MAQSKRGRSVSFGPAVNIQTGSAYIADSQHSYYSSSDEVSSGGDDHGTYDDILSQLYSFKPTGMTSFQAGFNVIATIIGAGILGIPYAIKQAGWVGLALLVFAGYMANYTGRILIKGMYQRKRLGGKKLKTYYDVGVAAFGRAGGITVMLMQYATLLAASILYLILAGINEQQLFESWGVPHINTKIYIAANVVFVLPTAVLLKTSKEISWVAFLGMCASMYTVVVIIILAAWHPLSDVKHTIVNVNEFPYAFATIAFAYSGHQVFPNIQHHMKSTEKFNRMFNISFLIVVLSYLPPAALAYWAYGDSTLSPILQSLHSGPLADSAILAITIHVLVIIPLFFNPPALAIESAMGIGPTMNFEVDEEGNIHKPAKSLFQKFEFLWRTILRSSMVIGCAGVAIAIPHFADFLALIGASCVTAVSFIVPCLIHIRFEWRKIGLVELLWNFFIITSTFVGGTLASIQATLKIINDVLSGDVVLPHAAFWVLTANLAAFGICFCMGVAALIYTKRWGWERATVPDPAANENSMATNENSMATCPDTEHSYLMPQSSAITDSAYSRSTTDVYH